MSGPRVIVLGSAAGGKTDCLKRFLGELLAGDAARGVYLLDCKADLCAALCDFLRQPDQVGSGVETWSVAESVSKGETDVQRSSGGIHPQGRSL